MAGFGAFGKIPSLGDFLRFDLPQSFVGAWDRLLQDALPHVRGTLGQRWNACYSTAPIWRFTLTAGLAGPQGAQGVVMPSVDRVGRLFPLTIAATLPAGRSAVQAHLAATQTFEALELIALDALDDAMTLAQLTERVRAVRLPGLQSTPIFAAGTGFLAVTMPGGAEPGHAIAAHEAAARFHRPSVWTAVLDGDTRMLLVNGLPGRNCIVGLFDLEDRMWHSAPPSAGPVS